MELDAFHKILIGAIFTLWGALTTMAVVIYNFMRKHSKYVRTTAPVVEQYRYEAEREIGVYSDPPPGGDPEEERTGVHEQRALDNVRRAQEARRRNRKSNPDIDKIVENYVAEKTPRNKRR